jgi:hypothetical protein
MEFEVGRVLVMPEWQERVEGSGDPGKIEYEMVLFEVGTKTERKEGGKRHDELYISDFSVGVKIILPLSAEDRFVTV